ncbi:hypothetical protein HBA55_26175 [Pseudomaricurvus alkylphenolicus]|uniref:hypothetical protein n=1 Tax=Pseudomaricurvus alkylphenolicus TaxID=1306991 RepID=UPI001422000B|nr:hypothetical protein [Pseudomaricurvus alkylphenolicus]NIB43122.1 hypothetical protein [Pseudomaricurvus alkylphenolicus]
MHTWICLKAVKAQKLHAVLMILLSSITISAHAYKFTPTSMEYMASTPMCRAALSSRVEDPAVRRGYAVNLPEEDMHVIALVGGWHYCGGAIRILRAKSTPELEKKRSLMEKAIRDIQYSFSKMDPSHWWTVEMVSSLAIALSELGKYGGASEVLDSIAVFHPHHHRIAATRGMLAYSSGEFQSALEYFQQADEFAKGKVAENVYFAGLAAYKLGNYELASSYASRAKSLNYPLDGLAKLLKNKNNQ